MKTLTGHPKSLLAVFGALVLGALPLPALATSASTLSSFEGIEEPSDRVSQTLVVTPGDTYTNITSPSSGTFRMELRYGSSGWDGDRDTGSTDRGRAEVKGLGAHQGSNATFRYKSTWKTSSGWLLTPIDRFCHIFQLKATDGNNGPPLVVQSVMNTEWTANVRYCTTPGACDTGLTVARSYSISAGTSKTVEIHIKTSTGSSGEVMASVNGDAFQGHTGLGTYLTGSTDYRPKWGLYRGFDPGMGLNNHYIEHSSVNAGPYTAPTPTPTPTPGGGGGSFSGYYKILGQASGRALVVQSASTANSASVILYDYNDNATDNDEWEVRDIGGGYYRIIARHSGKDLTVASASTASGANIIQYTYGGSATNDEWQLVDSGSGLYEIRNRNSGKNVQAMGTANSSANQQQSDNNGTNQRWTFTSIP
jgi:hypothetical protein